MMTLNRLAILIASAVCFHAVAQSNVSTLRLDQIQVLGTHNSYHQRPDDALLKIAIAVRSDAKEWDYSRLPFDKQLDLGARSFEFDLHLSKEGWEIFHAPVIDFRTSCRRFVDALKILRDWSDAHPGHIPIIVLMECKEEGFLLSDHYRRPELADLELMDQQIREAFGEKLLVPDDVRGEAKTLTEAVRAHGWPTLAECKGKAVFILHETGRNRDLYSEGRRSLEGRAMFVNSDPTRADAAAMVLDSPRDPKISRWVKEGFLIRTRVDTRGRKSADRGLSAIATGAQILTTDYPPGEPPVDGYTFGLPGGAAGVAGPFAPAKLRGKPIREPIE